MKSDFTNFLHFSFGFENPIYIIDPFRSSSKRKIDLNSASHELLNCWITILLSLAFVGWLTAISTIDCVATCHKSWDKNFVCRFSQLLIFMVFAVYAIPQRRIMEFEASSSQLRAKKISQQKNCRDKMILFINTYAIPPCFPGKKSLFVLAIIHAWNKNFISCSCHVIWIIVIHCKSVNCFSFAFEPLCANSDYCKIRDCLSHDCYCCL